MRIPGDTSHKTGDFSPPKHRPPRACPTMLLALSQNTSSDALMKIAVATAVCSATIVALVLGAIIAWEPNCGAFIYEFEFHSPLRRC
jgi:hypothetical protein